METIMTAKCLENEDREMPIEEEEAGFFVDDDQKADWCLQKIRECTEERDRWKAFYEARIKRMEDGCAYRIAFFEDKLKAYFATVPHKVTKTQENYQLPSGKLVYKRQGPEIDRKDDLLLPWLKENRPEMVKVSESVDWSSLKKTLAFAENGRTMVTEDGEIVPGITVTERPDVFKVEVK